MSEEPTKSPVQTLIKRDKQSLIPREVHLKAYEVYCERWGEQPALIKDGCRGGFGLSELIALLYARSFPKNEWKARVDEVLYGTENL